MKLNAILCLKKHEIISCGQEIKFIGCHGGDWMFSHVNGNIYCVDLVLNSIRETRFKND